MSPSPDTLTAESVAPQETTHPENTLREAVMFAKNSMSEDYNDPVPGHLITDDVSINLPMSWWWVDRRRDTQPPVLKAGSIWDPKCNTPRQTL